MFIDSRVNGYQQIIDALPAHISWFLINPAEDGMTHIQQNLARIRRVDSIHIISHGAQGMLFLGDTQLTASNLDLYANELESIGKS